MKARRLARTVVAMRIRSNFVLFRYLERSEVIGIVYMAEDEPVDDLTYENFVSSYLKGTVRLSAVAVRRHFHSLAGFSGMF